MSSIQPQYSFLETFIMQILEENGLGQMSETNKKVFVPQLVAEAEYRLGLALTPLLDQPHAEQFVKMVDASAGSEEWQKFWQEAVPNFDEVVKDTLTKFGEECQNILSQ